MVTFTGECRQELVTAVTTFDPGKAVVKIPAIEKSVDDILDVRSGWAGRPRRPPRSRIFWQTVRRKPGRIPQSSLRHNDTSPRPSDFAVDRQPVIGTTRFPRSVLEPSSNAGKGAHRAVAPGITGAPMAFKELICYVF